MCGRFALGIPRKKIRERFEPAGVPDAPPRFNIGPGQLVEALAMGSHGPAMGLYRWGLIPSWAKDPSIGTRLINARAETVWEKPAFKAAMRRRRCLIPAQGFYEWAGETGARQPWFVTPKDGSVMVMAGIWEHNETPAGEIILSLAVLTCPANSLLAPIHERMPVLVYPEDDRRWLDPGFDNPAGLADILKTREWPHVTAYQVGTRVNSVKNDGPDLIAPWPPLSG